MILTNYSWFELELNYGLLFYPNWELDNFCSNIVIPFTVIISNLIFINNFNTAINSNFSVVFDTIDLLLSNEKDYFSKMMYMNYILAIDIQTYLELLPMDLNNNYATTGIDYLWLFLYSDVSFIYIKYDTIINQLLNNYTLPSLHLLYNTYTSTIITNTVEFLWIIFMTWVFIVILLLTSKIIRDNKITDDVDFTQTRLYMYFYNLSKETRVNFELMLQFLLFFMFAWLFNLLTFDDINLEFVEFTHLFFFYFFLFIIIYLLFKYSIHYFAFLEPSVTEGKTSSFITKQFVRDVTNTFALFLRFFLLLFRLNIYDGLDDFLDSYCLFFYDFEEENNNSALVSSNNIDNFINDNSFDSDFQDKEGFLMWFENLFQLYLLYFFEISYFLIFILEELLRLSLAFYIIYLIIFEVHSVNCSFNEDNYVLKKRTT